MKKILFLAPFFFFTSSTQAIEIQFIGPCSSEPLHRSAISSGEFSNVGEVTLRTLKAKQIPYIGSEMGLSSIFKTPIGLDALEVISDSEMKAYGWCFNVDGVEPAVYPHEYLLTHSHHLITWFFGFAHYKDGVWISQCEPAHKSPSIFLCKDYAY